MDKVLESTLTALELARRQERYHLMRRLAAALRTEVRLSPDSEVPTRVSYELHMAAYEQAKKHAGARATRLLERSLTFAEQAAHEAAEANDQLGVLHAEMNISGLLLPALGRWEEGFRRSTLVSDQAEAIVATDSTSAEDRRRAQQVALNCYLHRGRMIVAADGDLGELARLYRKILANPIYQDKFRHIESIKRDIASFDAYLAN